MSEFHLKEVKFVPEIEEIPITLAKFKKQIEWFNDYNMAARLGKLDPDGDAIPVRYIGKNRYWVVEGEGSDSIVGAYPCPASTAATQKMLGVGAFQKRI